MDEPWWMGRLESLAQTDGPALFFEAATVQWALRSYRALPELDRVGYWVEACADPALLKVMRQAGAELVVASSERYLQLRAAFPQMRPDRVRLSPPLLAPAELAQLLALPHGRALPLTLRSSYALEVWPQLWVGQHVAAQLAMGPAQAGLRVEGLCALRAALEATGGRLAGLHWDWAQPWLDETTWRAGLETVRRAAQALGVGAQPGAQAVEAGRDFWLVLQAPRGRWPVGIEREALRARLAALRAAAPGARVCLVLGEALLESGVAVAPVIQGAGGAEAAGAVLPIEAEALGAARQGPVYHVQTLLRIQGAQLGIGSPEVGAGRAEALGLQGGAREVAEGRAGERCAAQEDARAAAQVWAGAGSVGDADHGALRDHWGEALARLRLPVAAGEHLLWAPLGGGRGRLPVRVL